jgi:serpin B
MQKTLRGVSFALFWLVLTGCAGATGIQSDQSSAVGLVKSQQLRITAPSVAPADLTTLSAGNSAFAFDLYRALSQRDGNLFYSPYSISLALAMTYAGARGETAQQMASALHWTLAPERLHPAFNWLDLQLAQRGQGAKGKDGQGFRLNIVNAIWGQRGYPFLPDFLDTLAENYGAGLRVLDFQMAAEPARVTINNWVDEQTEGKIKNLIPPGAIDALTRLVLTNAIYFNAAWAQSFDKNATVDGAFTLLDGRQVNVPMMRQTESFNYAKGNGYQAIELPYDGRQLSMLILLPDAGQFDTFEASLNAVQIDAIVKALSPRQMTLSMPRFKIESSFGLDETLRDLGMRDAFLPGTADFSGMTGNHDLFIGAVIHKAFVSVDEAGTEAAAATAVIMRASAMPVEPLKVNVDRPFVFLIRDIETGTILFVGRVLNPGA